MQEERSLGGYGTEGDAMKQSAKAQRERRVARAQIKATKLQAKVAGKKVKRGT